MSARRYEGSQDMIDDARGLLIVAPSQLARVLNSRAGGKLAQLGDAKVDAGFVTWSIMVAAISFAPLATPPRPGLGFGKKSGCPTPPEKPQQRAISSRLRTGTTFIALARPL